MALADTFTKNMAYNPLIHKMGIIIGIISIVQIASLLYEKGKAGIFISLSKGSFFIFAVHYLIIKELGKTIFMLFHIPENNPYAMIALYLIVPTLCVCICLVLYNLLLKFLPSLCRLLTGGR